MTQKAAVAASHLTAEFIRSMKQGDGWVIESDYGLNKASRNVVSAFLDSYENPMGGVINLASDVDISQVLLINEPVLNFSIDFVVPSYNQELETMIIRRSESEYKGVALDAELLDEIILKIQELDGVLLHWS